MGINNMNHMEVFYLYPVCNNLNDRAKGNEAETRKTDDSLNDLGFDKVLKEKSLQLQLTV